MLGLELEFVLGRLEGREMEPEPEDEGREILDEGREVGRWIVGRELEPDGRVRPGELERIGGAPTPDEELDRGATVGREVLVRSVGVERVPLEEGRPNGVSVRTGGGVEGVMLGLDCLVGGAARREVSPRLWVEGAALMRLRLLEEATLRLSMVFSFGAGVRVGRICPVRGAGEALGLERPPANPGLPWEPPELPDAPGFELPEAPGFVGRLPGPLPRSSVVGVSERSMSPEGRSLPSPSLEAGRVMGAK